ncbi:LytR family transcriptional regulator [Mesobacillus subterraneus]|uniref:polyisoprenyl-teichoic acid--peptidoglycan teichoic acid transferase TagU n=1 Tax=Mesobacillus subterraneus TaxID=285983 RepID=UPI00203A74BA|nr:LytR family transcriptional regulator [Mesobacillus subterraneus]MCM3663631.1 LytR family transcriptional regulator [Mesobacillus subterraneus]MCM3683397.1 LytR family transcriptional regulator [Mesobacillus subterraneus]
MRAGKHTGKKKRTWLRVIGVIFLLLILGVGAYAYSVYSSLTKAVDTMHQPIKREKSEKRVEEITLDKKEPFSVLMLGVDERSGDRGRSDTMIVLTVNPEEKSTKMLSIPRDTRTEIIGKGFDDKINHAYAFGGVEMSMNTVENFLDIPVDYYMQINMESFKEIVDAVGGVTVNNTLDFTYEGVHFPKGELVLNGEKALKYSRMRYEDPRGDFGRQTRQRQIIQGVINKGASFSSLTKFDEIFAALGKNVKTNLTFDEMVDIQKNYKEAGKNIQQMEIKGSGTKINRVYYLMVPDSEKQRVQSELKSHLNLQ